MADNDCIQHLRAQLDRLENKLDTLLGNALTTPQVEQGRDLDIDSAYRVTLDMILGETAPREGAKMVLDLLRPYTTNTQTNKPW